MGINDGLLGYWQFDEREGSTILDRSGNSNHGLIINGTRTEGKYGQALALTGNDNSHVSIPGSTSLNSFTDQITVTAWVFPNVPPEGFKVVVSRQVGTLLHPDQFYLGFGPENGAMHYKWHLGTNDSGNLLEGDIYSGIPEDNRWIHMAGTYDGRIMRLYIDGVEIDNHNLSGNIRVDDNPVTIGGEENGPTPEVVDGEFEGLIDEVRIYNRVLSATEINSIFELDAD
ncbi:MAG: LamG domain-containing protein [Calothrix sp. MO_167.B42]|nr:LamG domain-containing protein [Calothrix sp. MO_167.B42]